MAAHDTINIEWSKVISAAALGVVFAMLGSLAVWLWFRKVGHRLLLALKILFSIAMSISQFEIAANLYLHGVNFAFGWRAIACVLGLAMASYAWEQRTNLGRTLEASEKRDEYEKLVDQDRRDDDTMRHDFQMEALRLLRERAERRHADAIQGHG